MMINIIIIVIHNIYTIHTYTEACIITISTKYPYTNIFILYSAKILKYIHYNTIHAEYVNGKVYLRKYQ